MMFSNYKNPIFLWDKRYKINFKRLLYIAFLELKRIVLKKSYIAEIDVTNKCNLKCKHCFYFKNSERISKYELNIDEWKEKLISIHKFGIRRLCIVGGEPSLRIDVISEANKLFPYIDICSNGLIKIPESINHRIFISIDGNDEFNKVYRSNKILEKISENYFNDNRVVILMTLNEKNYLDINEVANFAIKNKINSLVFSLYTPTEVNSSDDLSINNDIRVKIINEVKEAQKRYPDLIKLSNFIINWYLEENHKNKCYWRDKVIHFDSLMNRREACVNMNCEHCGYFSGANIAPLNKFY